MGEAVSFTLEAVDGAARAGILDTPHGRVDTPAFMPVGTRAAVRAVDSRDLVEVGAQIVLANTYHLMLRPGADVVERLGGLHRFMAWDGPILTDSGGYQIFSLDPRISEDGATFRSSYDGARAHLTPEDAARIQERLGSDIAMVLDICVGLPAERDAIVAAMERTLRWTERFLTTHSRDGQAVFGIVQGGVDDVVRAESARRTALFDVDGYGIGGLSVGESVSERRRALEVAFPLLPEGKVRYVMGLGDPDGVLDAVALGADLFDCVWPTRLARHGRVLTPRGDFSIRQAAFVDASEPISADCPCYACQTYSRGYLRHLVVTGELLAHHLLTVHNLTYTLGLLADARGAIAAEGFSEFRARIAEERSQTYLSEPLP
jgi:queuine tRNA-ribosyltransferase